MIHRQETMTAGFQLNDEEVEWLGPCDAKLLDVLRSLGDYSVRYGCGTGHCGACTVVVDKKLVPSCLVPMVRIPGQHIMTWNGVREQAIAEKVQDIFLEEGAVQCGYCTPAILLHVTWQLDNHPPWARLQATEILHSHICRCTGYFSLIRAIEKAVEGYAGP